MIYSKGSVVVSEEWALDGLPRLVVMPDGCGEGEDALQDADQDSCWRPSAAGFEVELAFEGVEDRLDGLP